MKLHASFLTLPYQHQHNPNISQEKKNEVKYKLKNRQTPQTNIKSEKIFKNKKLFSSCKKTTQSKDNCLFVNIFLMLFFFSITRLNFVYSEFVGKERPPPT